MKRWSIVTSSEWIYEFNRIKEHHIFYDDDQYDYDNRYYDPEPPEPNFYKDHVENFSDVICVSEELLDILDNLYYISKQYNGYSRGSKQDLKDVLINEALWASDGYSENLDTIYWQDSRLGDNFYVIWLPYNIVGLTEVAKQTIQKMKDRGIAEGIIEYQLKKMKLTEGLDWIWKFDRDKWADLIEEKEIGHGPVYDWDRESYLALGGDINDGNVDLDKYMDSIGL